MSSGETVERHPFNKPYLIDENLIDCKILLQQPTKTSATIVFERLFFPNGTISIPPYAIRARIKRAELELCAPVDWDADFTSPHVGRGAQDHEYPVTFADAPRSSPDGAGKSSTAEVSWPTGAKLTRTEKGPDHPSHPERHVLAVTRTHRPFRYRSLGRFQILPHTLEGYASGFLDDQYFPSSLSVGADKNPDEIGHVSHFDWSNHQSYDGSDPQKSCKSYDNREHLAIWIRAELGDIDLEGERVTGAMSRLTKGVKTSRNRLAAAVLERAQRERHTGHAKLKIDLYRAYWRF